MSGNPQSRARHRPPPRHRNAPPSRSHRHSAIRYHAGNRRSEVSCFVKYSIFTFNVLFFILGFLLLGVGTWAQVEKNNVYAQLHRASRLYLDPSLALFVVGLITFIIGFSGCVGSLRENTTLLTLYSTLLGLLLLAEFAAAIYLYICREDFSKFLYKILDDMIISYRDDPDLQTLIDTVQQSWKCCGIMSAEDWEHNVYFAKSAVSVSSPEAGGVPFSCCLEEHRYGESSNLINVACGYNARGHVKSSLVLSETIFTEGCYTKIEDYGRSNFITLGIVMIVIAVVQFIVDTVFYFMQPIWGKMTIPVHPDHSLQMLGVCFAQNLKSDILAQKAKWLNS